MKKGDVQLDLGFVPIRFLNGIAAQARSEGNNAAWHCHCDQNALLIGRCYFQFGHNCHTVCPSCGSRYRVHGNAEKKAIEVVEY
jgi:uncharacterized Zn-finger protein